MLFSRFFTCLHIFCRPGTDRGGLASQEQAGSPALEEHKTLENSQKPNLQELLRMMRGPCRYRQ